MNRAIDWLMQSKNDLEVAKISLNSGYYEWSCFISQQAAEKAIKALLMSKGKIVWGHSISQMLTEVENVSSDLVNKAKILDKYYLPTRYPNAFSEGYPHQYYNRDEAIEAVSIAEEIITFCENEGFRTK